MEEVIIPEGTHVGLCSQCGVVTEDDIEEDVPNPGNCGICGQPLVRERFTDEDTKISKEEAAR